MIQRLLDALGAAATGAGSADLAGELSDALLLVESCQQLELTPGQVRALRKVEMMLERDPADPELPALARAALDALGARPNDSARTP